MFIFLIKCCHNWFLKKLKNILKKDVLTIMIFYFFMCDDLSFISTTQKTFKPSQKDVSIPRMNEKNLHTWEFQLKRSSRNMRCKFLHKRFTGKTTECSKHLCHIAIEQNILSELNRCIFQIPLKHVKLVISKMLFILVLRSFNFYFKITWPPTPSFPPNNIPPPLTKIKISGPFPANIFLKFLIFLSQAGGAGVHALKAQIKLSPLIPGLPPRIICQASSFLPKMSKNSCTH